MKLPLSLLRHYLEWDEPLSLLSETLTLLGIEVDRIECERPGFTHVVAATIVSTKPHPTSERMQVADVFDGAKNWQVVCAASNCRAGLKTAFAKAGSAILFNSEGELRIEETSIRGVPSADRRRRAGRGQQREHRHQRPGTGPGHFGSRQSGRPREAGEASVFPR